MPEAALLRRDRLALALLAVLTVAAGVLVEYRSAFMERRRTDLGVYLRASWAIREGINHYTVTDDNYWHYTYPSLLAITLVPFADAPGDRPQPPFAVPYAVSVALWYLLSVALLLWSVNHLCRALEDTHPDGPCPAPLGGRRFMWTRTWPVWVCLPAIGSTLFRGQVNLLTVALVSGCMAAAIRGHRAAAGWWLAAATCLKVIPGLLVLYPLVRRDWQMLGHYALGTATGLILIPVLALGPSRALATTETFVNQTILPGLTTKPGALSTELTDMGSTDNQSLQAIIHAAVNWNVSPRPPAPALGTKLAHVAIGLAMILWTFHAARRIPDERYRTLFLLSGLLIVAVAVTPVNHTHYMAMAVPAVLGLVYWELERRGEFVWSWGLVVVVLLHLLSGIWPRIPQLPGYKDMRELGVPLLGTLVVWYASLKFPTWSATQVSKVEPAATGSTQFSGLGVGK